MPTDNDTATGKTGFDVAFVGGGLANSLAALALRAQRPDLSIAIFEAGAGIGGNHTWSFHSTDLTAAATEIIDPLVTSRWADQEVAFPAYTRRLHAGYNSCTSERLDRLVRGAFGDAVFLNARVQEVRDDVIRLKDGRAFRAAAVIDGRGARPSAALTLGFQKFLGIEIETPEPHGVARPMIMDARVPQSDGYRFVYLLPFTDTRLLIEDTYYSDGHDLDQSALEERIATYCASRGWDMRDVRRTEHGILPIALAGDIDAFWRPAPGDISPARSGLGAALFHPTTGYSLPDAARFAAELARQPTFTTPAIGAFAERYSKRVWRDRGFYRFLNRMLFIGAGDGERRDIMQRFYTLGEPLIMRFFAAETTVADRARILIGKPPIPIIRGLRCIPQHAARPDRRHALRRAG